MRTLSILLGLLAALMPTGVCRGAARWQDTPSTQPTTRVAPEAPASLPATIPTPAPETRVAPDSRIAALREVPTAANAALAAAPIYADGPAARARLLAMLRERDLSRPVLEGVVSVFETSHDATVLPALFELFATADTERTVYLTARLRAFSKQQPMLPLLAQRIEATVDAGVRAAALRVLASVVDSPGERRDATRYLVGVLQDPACETWRAMAVAALRDVTFHDFPEPADWRRWFDDFAAKNPEGFAEADLYRSALRAREQRFFGEVARAVERTVAAGQVPDEWFDTARYPEPAIRVHAAGAMAKLRDAEPEVLRKAVDLLKRRASAEVDQAATSAMLATLGTLAAGRPDLAPDVATRVRGFLQAGDPAVIVAALKTLAETGGDESCAAVEAVYERMRGPRPEQAAVRAQVVATLYALSCGFGTIIVALGDPSPDVRGGAARVLGYGKRTESASRLAQALHEETKPGAELAMVKALVALQQWSDDVVAVLIDVTAKSSPAAEPAARGLLAAISTGDVTPERSAAVAEALGAAIPKLATNAERRAAFLADFQTARGEVAAAILVRWIEVETQQDVVKELGAALARQRGTDPAAAMKDAKRFLTALKPQPAIILMRAAVAFLGGAAATPAMRAQLPDAQLLCAGALLMERMPEGLVEAEGLATAALKEQPNAGAWLLLRGRVRAALSQPREAAVDLQAALKSDAAGTGDQRRDVERRVVIALLDSGDARAAKTFLDGLPPAVGDQELLIAAGRVEAALGHARQAIAHLRDAVKAPGKALSGVARWRLIEALLTSPLAAEHVEARRLFEALANDLQSLPDGYGLPPLRLEVERDVELTARTHDLDFAAADAAAAVQKVLVQAGHRGAVWAVFELGDLVRRGATVAVERRLATLKLIFPDDKTLGALNAPPEPATPEQWIAITDRVAAWWDARPHDAPAAPPPVPPGGAQR